jgi:hypothetical protein
MYAIVRQKAARNAWYWAVHLKRRGKLHFRRFYDGAHGGSRAPLALCVLPHRVYRLTPRYSPLLWQQ